MRVVPGRAMANVDGAGNGELQCGECGRFHDLLDYLGGLIQCLLLDVEEEFIVYC